MINHEIISGTMLDQIAIEVQTHLLNEMAMCVILPESWWTIVSQEYVKPENFPIVSSPISNPSDFREVRNWFWTVIANPQFSGYLPGILINGFLDASNIPQEYSPDRELELLVYDSEEDPNTHVTGIFENRFVMQRTG